MIWLPSGTTGHQLEQLFATLLKYSSDEHAHLKTRIGDAGLEERGGVEAKPQSRICWRMWGRHGAVLGIDRQVRRRSRHSVDRLPPRYGNGGGRASLLLRAGRMRGCMRRSSRLLWRRFGGFLRAEVGTASTRDSKAQTASSTFPLVLFSVALSW